MTNRTSNQLYWNVFIIGGYEGIQSEDGDHDQKDETRTQGSSYPHPILGDCKFSAVFYESMRDAKGRIPTLDEYATIASHEIGHQFELLHFNFDANLMHEDPTYRTNEFCYEYISSIRSIDAP